MPDDAPEEGMEATGSRPRPDQRPASGHTGRRHDDDGMAGAGVEEYPALVAVDDHVLAREPLTHRADRQRYGDLRRR